MPERQPIIPPGAAPNPNLSPGIRVGNMLYVSGNVGTDANGNLAEGCEAQSRQVMANIRAIVEAAGGRMEDVCKITCFLTNMDDYAAYSKVRLEDLAQQPACQLHRRRNLPGSPRNAGRGRGHRQTARLENWPV